LEVSKKKTVTYYVSVRNNAVEFISELSKLVNLVIFSKMPKDLTNLVINLLNIINELCKKYFEKRQFEIFNTILTEEHCENVDGTLYKNILIF